MIITKEKGKNIFTITGVTLGKLMAIENALNYKETHGQLTVVETDVYILVKQKVDAEVNSMLPEAGK